TAGACRSPIAWRRLSRSAAMPAPARRRQSPRPSRAATVSPPGIGGPGGPLPVQHLADEEVVHAPGVVDVRGDALPAVALARVGVVLDVLALAAQRLDHRVHLAGVADDVLLALQDQQRLLDVGGVVDRAAVAVE